MSIAPLTFASSSDVLIAKTEEAKAYLAKIDSKATSTVTSRTPKASTLAIRLLYVIFKYFNPLLEFKRSSPYTKAGASNPKKILASHLLGRSFQGDIISRTQEIFNISLEACAVLQACLSDDEINVLFARETKCLTSNRAVTAFSLSTKMKFRNLVALM